MHSKKTKNPWVDALHKHDLYKLAMSMAQDDVERQKISSLVESFVVGFSEVVPEVVSPVGHNVIPSTGANDVRNSDDSVITDTEVNTTESTPVTHE